MNIMKKESLKFLGIDSNDDISSSMIFSENNISLIHEKYDIKITKSLANKLTILRSILEEYDSSKRDECIGNKITSSKDILNIFKNLKFLNHEELWVIFLNSAHKIISMKEVTKGDLNSTIFDVRMIANKAISYMASGIILIHNHPSGNLEPSRNDICSTTKIKEALKLFDIEVIDHIIISGENYYSFADEQKY